jgi:hypothetical protein
MACLLRMAVFASPKETNHWVKRSNLPFPLLDQAKALETRATSWKRRCLRGKQLWRISKTMDWFKGKFTGNHRSFPLNMAKPVLWIHEYIDPVMCLSPIDIFIKSFREKPELDRSYHTHKIATSDDAWSFWPVPLKWWWCRPLIERISNDHGISTNWCWYWPAMEWIYCWDINHWGICHKPW